MPPKKKIAALVKVQLQAGAATPAPPVGTALGPHGVNIMDFCKAYNAQTESMRGNVIPVEITIYEDRSFTFITKTPPAAELIKKAAGLSKGSGVPHKEKVGKLTKDQVREIAQTKLPDLNANDIDAAMKIVEGTARSMGVTTELSELASSAIQLVTVAGPRWPTQTTTFVEEEQTMQRSKTYRAAADTFDKDELYAPLAAIKIAKVVEQEEVRRDRRRRDAARGRPPQGRPDGARHRQPAPRHRQDGARPRVRERRQGRRRP